MQVPTNVTAYIMERRAPGYLDFEEKLSILKEVCEELKKDFEECIEIVGNDFYHNPLLDDEQQDLIIDTMCHEFNLQMDHHLIDRYRHDTIFSKIDAPGIANENPVVFRCEKHSIFSCNPINANIEYLVEFFGEIYEGSDTAKLLRATLVSNHKNYYKSFF